MPEPHDPIWIPILTAVTGVVSALASGALVQVLGARAALQMRRVEEQEKRQSAADEEEQKQRAAAAERDRERAGLEAAGRRELADEILAISGQMYAVAHAILQMHGGDGLPPGYSPAIFDQYHVDRLAKLQRWFDLREKLLVLALLVSDDTLHMLVVSFKNQVEDWVAGPEVGSPEGRAQVAQILVAIRLRAKRFVAGHDASPDELVGLGRSLSKQLIAGEWPKKSDPTGG